MSQLGQKAKYSLRANDVRSGPDNGYTATAAACPVRADSVEKSFLGDERNFLEPLMRSARDNVRDHIVLHKNDHRPSYRRYRAFQRQKRLRINFGEILGVVRFSTFATWGNSGIEPDKGKGISSPGTYEARLMWPRNDGERQWNTMSDWTYR